MAALTGKDIVGVAGNAERGFIVAYREDGALCRAFVAPQEGHPDFQIARAYLGGVPLPAGPSKADEADFFRV